MSLWPFSDSTILTFRDHVTLCSLHYGVFNYIETDFLVVITDIIFVYYIVVNNFDIPVKVLLKCFPFFTDCVLNLFQIMEPKTFEELYTQMSHSPARRYFMIVVFTAVGIVFIAGLFCGRTMRRTLMMKNK